MSGAALHPREASLISLLLLKDEEESPQRRGLDPDLPQLAHYLSAGPHYSVSLCAIPGDKHHIHLSRCFRAQHRTFK